MFSEKFRTKIELMTFALFGTAKNIGFFKQSWYSYEQFFFIYRFEEAMGKDHTQYNLLLI